VARQGFFNRKWLEKWRKNGWKMGFYEDFMSWDLMRISWGEKVE
jgi:hypothetical protein